MPTLAAYESLSFDGCELPETALRTAAAERCAAAAACGRLASVVKVTFDGNNGAGDGVAAALAECLARAPGVTEISLGRNKLSAGGLEAIVNAICKHGRNVQSVSFYCKPNGAQGAPEALPKNAPPCMYKLLTHPADADSKHPRLKTLNLSDVPDAGRALGMLRRLRGAADEATSLQSLWLPKTNVTPTQLTYLEGLPLKTLNLADISDKPHFDGAGVAAYLRSAPELKASLTELDLSGRQIAVDGYGEVFDVLREFKPAADAPDGGAAAGGQLVSLNLGGCFAADVILAAEAVPTPAASPFVAALAKLCSGLHFVNLKKCGLQRPVVDALFDAMDWTELRTLMIDYRGQRLPTPTQLKQLKHRGHAPDAAAAEVSGLYGFNRFLAGTTRLRSLNFSWSRLKAADLASMFAALRRRGEVLAGADDAGHPLQSLHISNNFFKSAEGLTALRDAVCEGRLPFLTALFIDGVGGAHLKGGHDIADAPAVPDTMAAVLAHSALTIATMSSNFVSIRRLTEWLTYAAEARGDAAVPLLRLENAYHPAEFAAKRDGPVTPSAVLRDFLRTRLVADLRVLQLQHHRFTIRGLAAVAEWTRQHPAVSLTLAYEYAGCHVSCATQTEQQALQADPLRYFASWLPAVPTGNLANLDLSNPERCDVVGWWLRDVFPDDAAAATLIFHSCGISAEGLKMLTAGPFFTPGQPVCGLDLAQNPLDAAALAPLQRLLAFKATGAALPNLREVCVPWPQTKLSSDSSPGSPFRQDSRASSGTLTLRGSAVLAAFALADLAAEDVGVTFPGGVVEEVRAGSSSADLNFCATMSLPGGSTATRSEWATLTTHTTGSGVRRSSSGGQECSRECSSAWLSNIDVAVAEPADAADATTLLIQHPDAEAVPADPTAPRAYQVCYRKTSASFLGRGSFGSVYRGTCVRSGIEFAVKHCGLTAQGQGVLADLARETSLMQSLTHPNVVRFFGCAQVGDECVIVMECVGSTLTEVIRNGFPNPEEPIHEAFLQRCGRQILEGLSYLHGASVVHRDLKPSNILFEPRLGVCKLSDFGCSYSVGGGGDDADAALPRGGGGTCLYNAPEVFERAADGQKADVLFPVDVWAYGCTLLETATRRRPYDGLGLCGLWQLAHHIRAPNTRPHAPDTLSPELREVLDACFVRSPAQRASVSELLRLPFFFSSLCGR